MLRSAGAIGWSTREGGVGAPSSHLRLVLVLLSEREVEKALVQRSLAHFDGNVTWAAKALGISRAALYRRCEKFGIALGDD